MHIVLGLLGTIIAILVLLNRLAEAGIDLGGLNPFLWKRRRQWRKKYEGNPAFKLTDPMDITALLMVIVAKCDGDMTREQKSQLLELFESRFHLSGKDAQALLIASSHLHGDGEEVRRKTGKVIAPGLENFTPDQARSAVELVRAVAESEGASAERARLVSEIQRGLEKRFAGEATWA